MLDQEVELSHLQPQIGSEGRKLEVGPLYEFLKAVHSDIPSKVTSPPKTLSPTGDQIFKHLSLWGTPSSKPAQEERIRSHP